MPNSWTPDQIKQFQDYWDTEFSGDLARRRRAKFVPGDTAAKVHQTKEPEQKNDFDEWLARIICFAFSIPPQWAVRAMNRATADNQSAQSEEEGLEPTKEWVKDLVDEIIANEFASPDLELHWLDEDDSDAGAVEAALEARVKMGVVTLNELRAHLGLDPFANAAADRPMVLTAIGYVLIEANAGGGGEGALSNDHGVNAGGQNAKTAIYIAAPGDPEHPGWPAGTPGGRGGKFRPKSGGDGVEPSDDAAASHKEPEVLSDAPDPTWIPGARSAQASRGRDGGGGPILINGQWFELTFGQAARLEAAQGRWNYFTSLARKVDPEWKPKETVTSPDPEGEIAKLEGQAREAEDRLAEVTGLGIKPPPLGGHHYATRMLFDDFENLPLREDTRKVFDEARSGPLLDRSVNFFTAEHRAYSDAVEDAFRSFLAEKEISSEEMTPDQAREFLYEIFRSTDPRIHDFNMRIFEQRKLYLDRLLGIKDPKE